VYSIIIAVHPAASDKTISSPSSTTDSASDWRLGEITVDWVDFTREKSTDAREKRGESRADNDESEDDTQQPRIPGAAMKPKPRKRKLKQPETPDSLSRQTLLAHIPGGTPVPIAATSASGVTEVGRGVVHLFKHAPPASLVARLEGQNGESSRVPPDAEGWAGEHAEGGDGSLIAILAVPAWMRPADFLEFIGGWSTCLEGVRMIR
jgi:BRCA1-associated protein